jgi:hypothetical protein
MGRQSLSHSSNIGRQGPTHSSQGEARHVRNDGARQAKRSKPDCPASRQEPLRQAVSVPVRRITTPSSIAIARPCRRSALRSPGTRNGPGLIWTPNSHYS